MGDPCTSILFAKCLDTICQCFRAPPQAAPNNESGIFLGLEENWHSLTEEWKTLEAKSVHVRRWIELEMTQEQEVECKTNVQLWLDRVADAINGRTKLDCEYKALMRCGCDCTPNLVRRYKLGKSVVKKLSQVKKMITDGEGFMDGDASNMLTQMVLPNAVELRKSASPFTMEKEKERLQNYFENTDMSITGIYGTGGIGKTTLLNEFNNSLRKNKLITDSVYDMVIFIELSYSNDLNVAAMQNAIAKRVGLDLKDDEELRVRQLLKALNRRRFVMLLDNVREAFELERFGIPTPNSTNMCKLILASRSAEVCMKMGARSSLIEVKCREQEAAWELFKSNLKNEDGATVVDKDDTIKRHAQTITHKCAGLPLALVVVGKALALESDRDAWKHAAEKITQGLAGITGTQEALFVPLRYSYDQLKHPTQDCFLYCALFPEHSSIKKERMIDYWIGEGLIPGPYKGYATVNFLTNASLLEKGDRESEVRMHDIIREMALLLVAQNGNSFLVRAGLGLREAPEVQEWGSATRISLMSNCINSLPDSPDCLRLSTLLLQHNPTLHKLPPDFFRCMPLLTVLDLCHTAIEQLPIGTGVLGKLQYLNLSHTPIISLPSELSLLKELRYLNLSETSALKDIPNATISVLFELSVLDLYDSNYGVWNVNDLNIDGLRKLRFLGITIYSEEVLLKLQSTDRLAQSTQRLSLKHCEGLNSIRISVFKTMKSLKELLVHYCNGLKVLALDDNGNNLHTLTLANLPELETVKDETKGVAKKGEVNSGFLHDLCDLTIEACGKLENVSWVLQLKSLEHLVICKCHAMDQVVEESIAIDAELVASPDAMPQGKGNTEEKGEVGRHENQTEVVKDNQTDAQMVIQNRNVNGAGEIVEEGIQKSTNAFQRLRSIVLRDLDKLESICHTRYFPCLESISVENCPNLRRLPIGGNYNREKLKQIRGSQEWWNQLVWREKDMKATLSKYFVPTS